MLRFIPGSVLFWLKILSFGITNVLALLGLLYDFKDKKTGSLTRWGRVNLTGILASFVIGIAAQTIENIQDTDKAQEASKSMKSLVDTNQVLLGNVGSLLNRNTQLLDTMEQSLNAEKKTDADTQTTLHNVSRSLELAGNTIQVLYVMRIPLNDSKYDGDLAKIQKSVDELPTNKLLQLYWFGQDTQIAYTGNVAKITFGRQSPIIPAYSASASLMFSVPFSITFSKVKPELPKLAGGVFSPAKTAKIGDLVVYAYNDAATASVTPKPGSNAVGETPMMSFVSGGTTVFQFPWGETIFSRAGDPGQMLSTLDFGDKFMLVRVGAGLPVKFCDFEVKIGARFIIVPMKEIEEDANGDFIYQLPASMSQSSGTMSRLVKDDKDRCPDYQW